MHAFEDLLEQFQRFFSSRQFPESPATLYEPAQYILGIGGKRVRPVLCLMANELFGELNRDAFEVAAAVELFHNFTLIHDDIMDQAPLRRGQQTVHARFGLSTALLAGDVMLVEAYSRFSRIEASTQSRVLPVFHQAARQVCEGQQLDMDFESRDQVGMAEYLEMIALKTSVLLAASLQMGAILGGASRYNQDHLYAFGKNLGIAFQVQDDYLDAFGDPMRFGKRVGGDIVANKKTFLVIHALESCAPDHVASLQELLNSEQPDKVEKVLEIFRVCGVDQWARSLKEKYLAAASHHLDELAVPSARKLPLRDLMQFLVQRDH